MSISKLMELNNLASLHFRRKHIIILNPEPNKESHKLNENIEYDTTEWQIDDEEIQSLVTGLSQNDELSDEEKILAIYEKLCQKYVYDDNLISYIQKCEDDSFNVPDGYGRTINQKWKQNREQHNRRVCFELSRYLAKALIDLFEDSGKFDVCIFYDKSLTHYFVGVTCDDYSITLDLDDFSNIKDLTRLKTGLTVEGIHVLKDDEAKFRSVLDTFNDRRSKDAIKKIEIEVNADNVAESSDTQISSSSPVEEPDDIVFLRNAIEILREKYHIDSQGLFEYLKEIVDIKIGPESRKKVWKKIKDSTRCIRCLVLEISGQKYIIDVDEMVLRSFDDSELRSTDSDFMAYKELAPRNWKTDRYRGD